MRDKKRHIQEGGSFVSDSEGDTVRDSLDNMTTSEVQASTAGAGKRGGVRGIERISSFLLFALIFLLPISFVPDLAFPLQFGKSILLSIFTLLAFSLFVIARLKDGRFVIPTSPILVSLSLVVGLFALSGIFSGSTLWSLVGDGFEVGTALSLLIVALMTGLIPIMFRSREEIFGSYLGFFAAFILIAIFHLLRLVLGPEFLSVSVFTDVVSNTIGKWNDLGIFFGAVALLSLMTIEFLSLRPLFRGLLYLSLLLALFFLAIINFGIIWLVLGLFSLVFLVYLISFNGSGTAGETSSLDAGREALQSESRPLRTIPIPSLIVLLTSVVFILAGSTIGGAIGETFNISHLEARPSFQATFDVTREILLDHPLLGVGPNNFTSEWLAHKPAGINETIFWNVDFNYGVGLVPTFVATTGILGGLAWLLFLCSFLYAGFKAILSNFSDKFSQYLITSSFLVSLFFWIFNVFYIPSLTIFALTFFFTGLFVTALTVEKLSPQKIISFSSTPRANFVSVLLLILLLLGGASLGYFLIQKYVASVVFQKGVIAFNLAGDLDKAEGYITRATAMSPSALYYRFLTELTLMRMNALLQQNQSSESAEVVRGKFQGLLGAAQGSARRAVSLNPSQYENFLTLGRVYEVVTPLGVEGAYENAKAAYEQALALNPESPAIYLILARLEVAKKDNAAAREYIAKALSKKNNYIEAIFLLSQIEVAEGNIKAAISSVEAASIIAPNDATIFFQLGLLRFNDRDYKGAAAALERSVSLNPAYANAKYFLGLSYDRLNRTADAIAQFSDLLVTNGDNEEIKLILQNLKAGRDPFANAAPPVDATPEKRKTLPVSEKGAPKAAAPLE
ncbi:MAG: hypothetical protein A2849_01550 [Candidatus Taylorbacteria bacterium RIFCSPHIGHO2_01_FULL_51_15]|uniref:Uncharacterized protein n=1 Tax=Candidatus Taylorbacteria bacterium RIFCSPHIGHO2_01_FULL_51_15 TaxID=1802304 RepID=A0A1G2MBF9_9BACT|nr:MAG: hypothetical protein A2849_01550 [Candidatus Taylorbacteria bacterium RIFCSPHIGHO2_01_FULL_51_15]